MSDKKQFESYTSERPTRWHLQIYIINNVKKHCLSVPSRSGIFLL